MKTDKQEENDMRILKSASRMLEKTQEYDELAKSLTPIIKAIRGSERAKNILKSAGAGVFRSRFRKSAKRMRIFKEDAKISGTDEITTLRKAFLYLALFETSVTNLVDMVVMLFVANHDDFYVYRNRRYAKKLDDLDDAFLSEKLDFLNHHNLRVFSQHINRTLRNVIAHMDFDIEADGRITHNQQKFDLQREIITLEAFVLVVGNALKKSKLPELLSELS